jgi:hypothetical protein
VSAQFVDERRRRERKSLMSGGRIHGSWVSVPRSDAGAAALVDALTMSRNALRVVGPIDPSGPELHPAFSSGLNITF